MFTNDLRLTAAQITAITHKMKEGTISGRVTVRADLTEELARILECRELTHIANGAPRTNFEELALNTGCKAFRAVFEVMGLKQSYEMDGDEVGDIVVRPSAGNLRVEMRLSYHGEPLKLINYWMQVGSGEGTVKVVPLQTEMAAAAESSVEIHVTDAKGNKHVEKVAKSAVRKAVLAGDKGKKRWGRGVN